MKKVFFGLAVAAVALSASAFTNAVRLNQAYVTGATGTAPNRTFSYNQIEQDCEGDENPCKLISAGSSPFNFGTSGNIAESVVNGPNVDIDSEKGAL
ncbi:hypothetical protein [Pedobacter frigoris]|uniref:Uncharacterized protein n=1 Tax=Pedobacter frigoris TaxID=2571272 RepID=A0A4U1CKD8_9SPHI|nr:hypothetical protein [Pedobacter frigoris]TKC07500.1 hypothetical protein FA047_09650 [Pedobacter frigoris]